MEPHAPQAPAVIARPPRPTNDVFLVWAPRRCSRPTGPPTARRIQRALVPCLAPPVVCTWCQIVYIEALGPPPGPDHRPSSASPTCVWCIIILASSSRLYHHITCPPLSLAQRPRFPPFLINPVEILLIPTWFFRSGPLPCLGVRLFCAQCMRLVESHSRWPCNSFNPHPAYP